MQSKTSQQKAQQTIKEAQDQLTGLRRQQREIRKTIEQLRSFLKSKGVNPGPPPVDLSSLLS